MKKKVSNWVRQNTLPLALSVIFLAVGTLLGLGINYQLDFGFRFDDKINPTDLLQVFVGVILVWVIASSLEKKKLAERNSKEILQRRVRELHTLVDQFSEHKFNDNYAYVDATSALKRIETGLESIRRLIEATGLIFPDSLLDDVNNSSTQLDGLLTNTPLRDQEDDAQAELTLAGGICTFGDDLLTRLNESFDQLKHALLELEIRINVEDVPTTGDE